ncbi:MAG: VOC family protein [Deltaproteobacteria bacterium]|nr:VOC family protein [Candidatus Zymogenaceae bacterium]
MRFDHVGIKSNNVEKSLDFYTRILGFQILEKVDMVGRSFYFIGNDETKIEIEDANPGDVRLDCSTGYGLYHIALIVKDIDALAERLKAEGVTFIMEPIQLREDRKIAFIEDPDGVHIQLIDLFE